MLGVTCGGCEISDIFVVVETGRKKAVVVERYCNTSNANIKSKQTIIVHKVSRHKTPNPNPKARTRGENTTIRRDDKG